MFSRNLERTMSHQQNQQQRTHIALVFVVYAVVIFLILALINYMIFPLMYIFSLVGVSLVAAVIATYVHWRSGERSNVDDMADRLKR
jgi:fatty acid desaturase